MLLGLNFHVENRSKIGMFLFEFCRHEQLPDRQRAEFVDRKFPEYR